MKHCGTQELETQRLILRRLSMDDSEMMYNNWASDKQVTQYLRWTAHRSWGETAETLNEWEKHYDDPAFYQWGITDRHTGVLFGSISLFPAPALKTGWHLNTERLVLRRLSIDDSEMMYNNWANDRQVTQYLRWNAHRSWGETAETLNEWEKHYDDPAFYQWGITDKHTGVLFGTISLFPAPALKMGWHLNTERLGPAWEVGYALGRKWWNKGYATEALCTVRDYWFDTVGADWLAAVHANENIASSAVLQKAGFVYDHDVTDRKFDGTPVPCRAYHLLKEEL